MEKDAEMAAKVILLYQCRELPYFKIVWKKTTQTVWKTRKTHVISFDQICKHSENHIDIDIHGEYIFLFIACKILYTVDM